MELLRGNMGAWMKATVDSCGMQLRLSLTCGSRTEMACGRLGLEIYNRGRRQFLNKSWA